MSETLLLDSLTIIIPTYNREKVLTKALNGYLAQSSPHLIHELLVVDDGSTDGTESMVREIGKRSPFPIRYLRQPNKGPAAARNLGISEARAALVLFTDSDIIPERSLVEQHVQWHRNDPQISTAVLGYVTWSPEVKATPFMRWYGEVEIFGFRRLRDQRVAGFQYFYTCNVSLKTDFLRENGQFDEQFRTAAYEDTELGYRLARHGLKLLYNSDAVGYHYQFFSLDDACKKRMNNAAAAKLFFQTDAGLEVLKEIRRKHSRFGYKFAQRLATTVATLFSPARRILDSAVPLPGIVYRLFFWAATRQPAEPYETDTARNNRVSGG